MTDISDLHEATGLFPNCSCLNYSMCLKIKNLHQKTMMYLSISDEESTLVNDFDIQLSFLKKKKKENEIVP